MYLNSKFPTSSNINTWYRPIVVLLHHSAFSSAAYARHSTTPISRVRFVGTGHFSLFLAELQPVSRFYYFIRIYLACWAIPKKQICFSPKNYQLFHKCTIHPLLEVPTMVDLSKIDGNPCHIRHTKVYMQDLFSSNRCCSHNLCNFLRHCLYKYRNNISSLLKNMDRTKKTRWR